MFVDADFAGHRHKEYLELRDSVLLRTGYVITFCGCPVTWCSKLQSEIALSMTESEYIALSMATRDLLPLCHVLQDIEQYSFIQLMPSSTVDKIHASKLPPTKIFEDNNACIILATTDMQFKPRTKQISIKYHHFHDQICNGNLEIIKANTVENIADIFTKPHLCFIRFLGTQYGAAFAPQLSHVKIRKKSLLYQKKRLGPLPGNIPLLASSQ